MVEIRYVKINGLYSYGSEKNRIDFGKRTVVVGANDSGKSSIFKALSFFLKCLIKYDHGALEPWDRRGTHEMTVGLSLNGEERRYAAEVLTVINESGRSSDLAPDEVVRWLAPGLGRVELTISWRDHLFRPAYERMRYSLRLEDLAVTVCQMRFDDSAWAIESSKLSQHEPSNVLLSDVIAEMLKEGPGAEDLGTRLVSGAAISKFPDIAMLGKAEATTHGRNRIELVARVSSYETQRDSIPPFMMFGLMLRRGFAFVSEQRTLLKSNNLERSDLPGITTRLTSPRTPPKSNSPERPSLNSDGSNLQVYLFWLQNGDKGEQDAFSAIRRMFEGVMKQQNLSFVVSATEKKVLDEKYRQTEGKTYSGNGTRTRRTRSGRDLGKRKICPDKAIVRFVKTLGQEQRLLDFMSVGAGVRETLFLLTMCFGRHDGVVLLDEPAANLHPTQIRRLMREIMSAGDQSAKSGQVALITHSPTLASLQLLSRANEIVRVNRREYSLVAQPSGEDREWIEENLPTFHHLKSDVFFARGIVLVEGPSDRFFLEAILDRSLDQSDDIAVVDVGGKGSFKKFRDLLGIFEIPYVALADDDAENLFDSNRVLKIGAETVLRVEDGADKSVCILEKTLEGFLSGLEPELYANLEKEYKSKPERAYHFAEKFLAGDLSEKSTKLLNFLIEWISKSLESAGQYGDPQSNQNFHVESASGAAQRT